MIFCEPYAAAEWLTQLFEDGTMELTAGSLFSGIGGIDLAFSLAGFDIRYQVEINPFCRKVLRKHAQTYWKNAALYADILDCGNGRAHELPRTDALYGGFPCQSTSNAGKREGIREGTKSGLWYEYRRLIGELRPRAVLLENVEGILHKGRGGPGVIADLAALGYVGRWGIISAADSGALHLRNRWFCVGYAGGIGQQKPESTGQLCDNEERHDSTCQLSGSDQLHPSVSAGEMGNPDWQRCPQDDELNIGGGRAQLIDGNADSPVGNANSLSIQRNGTVREQIASVVRRPSQPERAGRQLARRRNLYQSSMGRNVDGLSRRMDGTELMQHRFPAPPGEQFDCEPPRTTRQRSEDELEAYGNAVVPQVVYPIAKLLYEVLL